MYDICISWPAFSRCCVVIDRIQPISCQYFQFNQWGLRLRFIRDKQVSQQGTSMEISRSEARVIIHWPMKQTNISSGTNQRQRCFSVWHFRMLYFEIGLFNKKNTGKIRKYLNIYRVSQKNAPMFQQLPTTWGRFFLGHGVYI